MFPCHHVDASGRCSCAAATCDDQGKHPLGRLVPNGYRDASAERGDIERWWAEEPEANIAVATGFSDLVVLDVDAHRGGAASLQALEQQHGPLPPTYCVRTPRGGTHHYFKNGGIAIRSRGDVWPGIDVKAQGGYVIAAGSRSVFGSYDVLNDREPADLPAWIVPLLPGGRTTTTKKTATSHWVTEALKGVPDGNRTKTCTQIAGYFCNRGLDPSVIEGLVVDFAGRCQPPLDADKALATARSIMSGAGLLADEETQRFGEDAHRWMTRIQAAPAPGYLIPRLIRDSSTALVHGQPRAGKTLLLMELALTVSHGVPAFHLPQFTPTTSVPVFYATEEDPENEVGQRLGGLLRGHGGGYVSQALTMAVRKGINLDSPRHQARLIEEIRERGDRVVIFEPLRSFTACVDQGPAEFQPIARFFRRLMRETGCVVWAGHHDTKPINGRLEQRARPQRASGGGVFAFFDCPIHVEALDTSPLRALVSPTAFKFGSTPEAFSVALEADEAKGTYRLVGQPVAAAHAGGQSLASTILNFVRANPSMSGSDIAGALKRNKAAVLTALTTLEAAGELLRTRSGRSVAWATR